MKKTMLLVVYALVLIACSHQAIDTDAYLDESRKTAKNFMQTLGGTLKRQIKTGGVESAIPVCKEIAPAIADKFSQDGQLVKRVSTKARNTQQGTPDEWELSALKSFEQASKTDTTLTQLEKADITKENGVSYYRYAKGIRVKPVCLNCHGSEEDIKPNVKAVLAKHYPNDIATGYQLGDLRGAISIKHQLDF